MAASLGVLFVLLPNQTVWGLTAFGSAYLVTHSFDLSAAVGLGLLAFLVWNDHQPPVLQAYTILLFLAIPAKKILDWPRRRRLQSRQGVHPHASELGSEAEQEWADETPVAKEGTKGV
jgi:hypothetical protein